MEISCHGQLSGTHSTQRYTQTRPSQTYRSSATYDHNLIIPLSMQCIAGLALSNANYDQAICLLREQYGDELHIVDAF